MLSLLKGQNHVGAYPFGDPPMTILCEMLGVHARPLRRCERLIPLVEKKTF